jgi:hypothetical protein
MVSAAGFLIDSDAGNLLETALSRITFVDVLRQYIPYYLGKALVLPLRGIFKYS